MWASHSKGSILTSLEKWKSVIIPLTIFQGLFVFWEGKSRYLSTWNYTTFYSQWRPSVMIYTLLIALSAFYIFEKTNIQFPKSEKLSKLSYFVFFVHVIVLEVTWSLFGKSLFNLLGGSAIGKIFFDPIFFVIVTSLSFLIAFLIHKIPYLHKVTG